jgi:TonB family protein
MAEPGSARSAALLLLCALACTVARAQPASQPSAAASAAERAQKETDRTMYWIRVLATTPAPVKAATAPKAVTAATLAAAAKPVAETRDKAKAVPAQAPAIATAAMAASSGVLAPTAVAHASRSAQAPVGDASEPSALSSRGADIAAAAVANTESAPQPDVAASPMPEPDPGLVQVKSVQPEFPITVIERLRKGHVEVRFEVEPGGSVIDATVVASSASRLNGAALEAVAQWRFKPTPAFHTALVDLVFNVDKSN